MLCHATYKLFKTFHHPYHMYYMKHVCFKYRDLFKFLRWLKPVGLNYQMLFVPDCARPLGLEDNKNQIRSPASLTDLSYPPNAARLNGPSAWCPSRAQAYIQIDLDKTYKLTAIATQGGTGLDKWVQSYRISFYAGGTIIDYTESGSRKVRFTLLLYFHFCQAFQQFTLTSGLLNKTMYEPTDQYACLIAGLRKLVALVLTSYCSF